MVNRAVFTPAYSIYKRCKAQNECEMDLLTFQISNSQKQHKHTHWMIGVAWRDALRFKSIRETVVQFQMSKQISNSQNKQNNIRMEWGDAPISGLMIDTPPRHVSYRIIHLEMSQSSKQVYRLLSHSHQEQKIHRKTPGGSEYKLQSLV